MATDIVPGLVYADIEAAHTFLTEVFGATPGELARDEQGTVVHGEVRFGDRQVWLHQASKEFGLDTPASAGVNTSVCSVLVDDVDARFGKVQAGGARIVYEPTDMPYGYREFGARDGEGRLWSFMSPSR